jgi:hypothetical protein
MIDGVAVKGRQSEVFRPDIQKHGKQVFEGELKG